MSGTARAASWKTWLAAGATALLVACGGGGGDAGSTNARAAAAGNASAVPGSNVLPIRVDAGTDGSAINQPFVSITICEPGTSNCATVDRVIVDTGSSGLRLSGAALPASLRQLLPVINAGDGSPAGQCAQFASGFAWGSVRQADVRMGGETAARVSIQVINDPVSPYAAVPAQCSSTGADIGGGQGANGILGVGFFDEDCGVACAVSSAPRVYYGCSAAGCTPATMPLASQVSNPVARLPVNNNGVVVVLPEVPLGGVGDVQGSLVLGIGTQANNALAGETVLAADARGFFTTIYQGTAYTESFIDSGSNGLFFNDPSLPRCGDFYCPGGALSLSATNVGADGATSTVSFLVEDVTAIAPDASAAHLGGSSILAGSFDWGLPFFFGRRVFVAREGAATPYGTGPYWAY